MICVKEYELSQGTYVYLCGPSTRVLGVVERSTPSGQRGILLLLMDDSEPSDVALRIEVVWSYAWCSGFEMQYAGSYQHSYGPLQSNCYGSLSHVFVTSDLMAKPTEVSPFSIAGRAIALRGQD